MIERCYNCSISKGKLAFCSIRHMKVLRRKFVKLGDASLNNPNLTNNWNPLN